MPRMILRSVVAIGLLWTVSEAAAQPGSELYILRGCLGCHGASGRGGVGPALAQTPLPFDGFLKQVRQPRAIMPPFPAEVVSDAEAHSIYEYLMTSPPVAPRLRVDIPKGILDPKTCTPCHANPPSTGRHTSVSSHRSQSCGACHASYSSTTVNKAQHVNGTRDVGGSGTRITSWNASTRTCSSSCHGSQTW